MILNLASMHIPALMVNTFITLLSLIVLDTVLGLVSAAVKSTWQWTAIARFLETSVLPYLGGLLALGLLALIQADMLPVFYSSAAAASIKLVADIMNKISQLGVKVGQPAAQTTTSTPAIATGTTEKVG